MFGAVDALGFVKSADGGQQSAYGIQRAVQVVVVEGILVRPAIASFADLGYQTSFDGAQSIAEDVVPGHGHHAQGHRDVTGNLSQRRRVVGSVPAGFHRLAHLVRYVGSQAGRQQSQGFTDKAVVVVGRGGSHGVPSKSAPKGRRIIEVHRIARSNFLAANIARRNCGLSRNTGAIFGHCKGLPQEGEGRAVAPL